MSRLASRVLVFALAFAPTGAGAVTGDNVPGAESVDGASARAVSPQLAANGDQQPGGRTRTYALISTLGAQIQLVARRHTTEEDSYPYERRTLTASGSSLDVSTLKAMDSALESIEPTSHRTLQSVDLPPSRLWRYEMGKDPTVHAVSVYLRPLQARARWDEIIVVTPAKAEAVLGFAKPPKGSLRGIGIYVHTAPGAPRDGNIQYAAVEFVSVFAYVTVRRFDAQTLELLASEDVHATVRIVEGPEGTVLEVKDLPREQIARGLIEVAARTAAEGVHRLYTPALRAQKSAPGAASPLTQAATADEGAHPPERLPEVSITGNRAQCRELRFRWIEALSDAWEARHLRCIPGLICKEHDALSRALWVFERMVALDCPNTAVVCGDERALVDALVDDIDPYEELHARGVHESFLARFYEGPQSRACREKLKHERLVQDKHAPGD